MGLLDQIIGGVLGSRMGGGMGGGMGGLGGMLGGGSRGGTSPLMMALMALLASKAMGSGGGMGGLGGLLGGGMGNSMGSGMGGLGGMLGGSRDGMGMGGGLGGLLGAFQQSGHGHIAQSWVDHGDNHPIAPNQLMDALGPDTVDQLQQQTGMPREQLLEELSHTLPEVVDKLTPNGRLPTDDEMQHW
ncbi:MAG TPA: YidB family protein [Microvirga sp.]|jgi:uncharacterized protein YidB (DUF937 family)|nr:YidB family protein [Microvirga sp.]